MPLRVLVGVGMLVPVHRRPLQRCLACSCGPIPHGMAADNWLEDI